MPDEQQQGKPAFEPPPWEREAFDELARKRAADQERDRAAMEAAATEAWASRAAAASQPDANDAEGAQTTGPADGANDEPATREGAIFPASLSGPAPIAAEEEDARIDERRVAAMLLQLEGEEVPVEHAVRPLSTAVSIVIGVIGVGTLAAALYFAAKTGGNPIGAVGALAIGGLGAFLIGTAIWLRVRTTRVKGS